MSTVPVSALDKQHHAQLCCTYAALILQDEGMDINSQQMKKLIETSGNKVESFWPGLFARALNSVNVAELILSGGAGAGASAGAAVTATVTETSQGKTAAAPVETKKEEKKEEQPAEQDMDMGGLFDF